ncbi:hypothetical protein C0Z16_18925 [Paraburkholderia rhynchosiae]|uniref:Uncharacterized protein n=1 Tax=Paraburkholderia rhynchosiae TaxID=487049 RepID=A0ABX4V5B5_9BURK|nr:hypothetical protein C0Z16_18925 [Paraburkholderia rhynchosiae]
MPVPSMFSTVTAPLFECPRRGPATPRNRAALPSARTAAALPAGLRPSATDPVADEAVGICAGFARRGAAPDCRNVPRNWLNDWKIPLREREPPTPGRAAVFSP